MRAALVLVRDQSAVVSQLASDGFVFDSSGPLNVTVCELISPAAGTFSDTPDWARLVADSVAAPFQQVRQVLPQLRRGTDARVIFVIDGWRAAAQPGSTAAVAANGALIALVKTLARDLGDDGITVNAIARDATDNSSGLPRAISYLASPLAGALTGQILTLGSGGEIRP